MAEALPNEADQDFLYQLICSQLENDGYIKSAKCLQVELNSVTPANFSPGDKLEKLVQMCIQIKKHIDGHFHNHSTGKGGSMDADSTNKSPSPADSTLQSPAEDIQTVKTSDATSSEDAVLLNTSGLDSDTLKQQLYNQHIILQQIRLQQQHLHTGTLDEQTKRLSEYMLNCYKSDFSMVRESTLNPRSDVPAVPTVPTDTLGASTSQGPQSPSTEDKTSPTCKSTEMDRKRFPCRYCGRRFTQQSALQVHERTHTGEKPYHCHYCDKAFTQISNLKCHERLHTGEKPYRCQLCGKRFTQSASLRCHMRSHTGERPYLCKYCNKRFTQPASLQHHIRIHTGEKPYKCEHCGKCFTQPSSLVVHRRLHTGERPFVCQICGKSYTQAMPLKEHMRSHHIAQSDKSPVSFSVGRPFSLQIQNSLSTNLPFLLSNKLLNLPTTLPNLPPALPNLATALQNTISTHENPIFSTSPTDMHILFNRGQNTAFQAVFPTVKKESEGESEQPGNGV